MFACRLIISDNLTNTFNTRFDPAMLHNVQNNAWIDEKKMSEIGTLTDCEKLLTCYFSKFSLQQVITNGYVH